MTITIAAQHNTFRTLNKNAKNTAKPPDLSAHLQKVPAIVIAILGMAVVLSLTTIPALNASAHVAPDSYSTITVNSILGDKGYNEIFGFYTTLWKGGAFIDQGYTSALFNVPNEPATYQIQVADYGDYVFDHWADGSKDRAKTIQIDTGTHTGATAVYRKLSSPDQSSVVVLSTDSIGHQISGYYAVLYQNRAVVKTSFTPTTFPTISGQTYTIEVQDYGSYYFNHWSDNGDTNKDRTFTATTSTQTFEAVYATLPQSGTGGGGTGNTCDTTGCSTASILTHKEDESSLPGYYASLWQNGVQIDSCFTFCDFVVNNGQTYQIAVADYGSCTFAHWGNLAYDGSTDRFLTIMGHTSTAVKYHAYYHCT